MIPKEWKSGWRQKNLGVRNAKRNTIDLCRINWSEVAARELYETETHVRPIAEENFLRLLRGWAKWKDKWRHVEEDVTIDYHQRNDNEIEEKKDIRNETKEMTMKSKIGDIRNESHDY